MAPKLQIAKTFAAAVKEGNQNISGFFNHVKRKPGRPKKATIGDTRGDGTGDRLGIRSAASSYRNLYRTPLIIPLVY
jgi:hypothetical protein